MSKQSNQKYRKEKERTHLKKAGIDVSQSAEEKSNTTQDRINHTFGSQSDKS